MAKIDDDFTPEEEQTEQETKLRKSLVHPHCTVTRNTSSIRKHVRVSHRDMPIIVADFPAMPVE